MGLIGHGNTTQCNANTNCAEIIDENAEYTKRLGFKITETVIPIMYQISKMQRNPTDVRFIIASKICSTK